MGRHFSDESFLAALPPAFRRQVEASAASIVLRIAPATADRLEGLATLAASEASRAESRMQADAAFALAAELKRRARLLQH